MTWIFNGLPLHVLLVHFVVIVVPLAAVVALVVAVWPAARRRIGIVSPIIALAALVSVPLATQAGEALEEMVGHSEFVEAHAELGDTLLPWAALVFVLAAAHWAWFRFVVRDGRTSLGSNRTVRRVVAIALAAAIAVVAVGSVVSVVLIGESGARAVWTGQLDSRGE